MLPLPLLYASRNYMILQLAASAYNYAYHHEGLLDYHMQLLTFFALDAAFPVEQRYVTEDLPLEPATVQIALVLLYIALQLSSVPIINKKINRLALKLGLRAPSVLDLLSEEFSAEEINALTANEAASTAVSWRYALERDIYCPILLEIPEIEDLVVFEKQYFGIEGQWRSIQNTARIFSRTALYQALNTADPRELFTRDSVTTPHPYIQGMHRYQTRWQLLFLNQNNQGVMDTIRDGRRQDEHEVPIERGALGRFDSCARTISTEKNALRDKAAYNSKYAVAATTAEALCDALAHARRIFIASSGTLDDRRIFIDTCRGAVDSAKPVLEKHQDWTQVLLDIANVLVSLLTLGVPNLICGRLRLFTAETDAGSELARFEQVLTEITGP